MNGEDKLKVLFVEDLPSDAELALRTLKAGGLDVESMRVDTKEAFLEALAAYRPDIVISDFAMPVFDGMSALRLAMTNDPTLPFIILTGSMNEDTAVECMKAGASDYVIKEHMTRLPYAVNEALERREILVLSAQKSVRLRESEERYRSLFEESHAVMLILDPEEAVVVEANQAACEFYGWPREKLVGMKMTEYNTTDEEEIKKNIQKALVRKKHNFTFQHRKADGSSIDVETYSGPITLGGRRHMFSIIHDISERIAAERERDEMSARLGHYLATSPTVTYSLRIKEGKAPMQWVSENIVELLGYSVAEALEPDWWLRNVHASDRMRALGGISRIAKQGACSHEYRFNRKDRAIVWIRDDMRFVQGARGEAEIVGTLTDVSDRKKVELELSLKSQALEAAANAVVITDREGTIQWTNQAFEVLTGYRREEVVGQNPRLLKSGKQEASYYRSLWETILAGKVWQGEMVNRRKGGELYTEEMTITPVLDEARYISGFIAIKSDVTERMRSRERLEASLEEKEVLLREIHHRINNNMQLVNSLLSLSSKKFTDPALQELLGGVSQRLLSMAFVHEQFYNSPDMARIDFALYIHQLADGLCGDFRARGGKVCIVTVAHPVLLNLEKAIPAGLTVAELIANALKHAYPGDGPAGEIRVSMKSIGSSIELSVRDDGTGLPPGFAAGKAETLGMILIHNLAQQLGGKVEFSSRGGTDAILRFPIQKKEGSSLEDHNA